MPCYTVRTIKTDLGKVNFDRLAAALIADGWGVTRTNGRDGELFAATNRKTGAWARITKGQELAEATDEATLSVIKKLYTLRTLADAAKKFGMLQKSKQNIGNTVQIKFGR